MTNHPNIFISFKDLEGYFRKRYRIPNSEYRLWEAAHSRLSHARRKEKGLETAIPNPCDAFDPHANRNHVDDKRTT
jgi:hypothetical protein